MMILRLCNLAHSIRERDGGREIRELEISLEALHAFHFDHPPLGQLRQQLRDAHFGNGWLAAPAGHTTHLM
jgi:hypothetical protein